MMFFRTMSAVMLVVTMALFSVGCGADESTESMSAQVNPALIARSLESQTFEVVARNDDSAIVEVSSSARCSETWSWLSNPTSS